MLLPESVGASFGLKFPAFLLGVLLSGSIRVCPINCMLFQLHVVFYRNSHFCLRTVYTRKVVQQVSTEECL